MAKSIKLKNNTYWDSESVIFKNKTLKNILNNLIPSSAVNNVNLNDYTNMGFYYIGTNCSNSPLDYIYLQVISNGGDLAQIAYSVTDSRIWKRGGPLYNGERTWTNWEQILTPSEYKNLSCFGTFASPRKTISNISSWVTTEFPLVNGTDTFVTDNSNMFEAATNGIKCKFTGSIMVERTISSSTSSEFDLTDAYGTSYNAKGGTSTSFSVQRVNSGDIIKLQFITGATNFESYSARLSVVRIS